MATTTTTGGIKMKVTNVSSQYITLCNGKKIAPSATVYITVKKGSDLYKQIMNLSKLGVLYVIY